MDGINMYHVSAQGVDERMINVHYYYDDDDDDDDDDTRIEWVRERDTAFDWTFVYLRKQKEKEKKIGGGGNY